MAPYEINKECPFDLIHCLKSQTSLAICSLREIDASHVGLINGAGIPPPLERAYSGSAALRTEIWNGDAEFSVVQRD